MDIPSILRKAEHEALRALELEGEVLDVGGSKKSAYQTLMQGNYALTTVNLDPKALPDIAADLEKPLPLRSAAYDAALLINTLEHIYEHRQLLSECVRVIKRGGKIIIIVPFLFPVHPSPKDFWRFTEGALRRECEACGLEDIEIKALGSGFTSAQYLFFERLLPSPLRLVGHYSLRYLVLFFDALFAGLARMLGKAYRPEDYALGYFVSAKKV